LIGISRRIVQKQLIFWNGGSISNYFFP
jgi:hypothetical protein